MRDHYKRRHINGHIVSGHAQPQADGASGEVLWHVSVYRGANTRPHHDVFVIGGVLHATKLSINPKAGPKLLVGDPITHPPAEQAAILKAVDLWTAHRNSRPAPSHPLLPLPKP